MAEDTGRGQTHVHEFTGSTQIAEIKEEPHNHRFTGVSGEMILCGDSHVHELSTNTDFFDDHHHEIGIRTGPAIPVAPHKHVHFAFGRTTCEDDHVHRFIVATLIEDPLVWHYSPNEGE